MMCTTCNTKLIVKKVRSSSNICVRKYVCPKCGKLMYTQELEVDSGTFSRISSYYYTDNK